MNIKKMKTEIMAQSVANDHRMTRFGNAIRYKGETFFSALCKDCCRTVRIREDGTISGDVHLVPCE